MTTKPGPKEQALATLPRRDLFVEKNKGGRPAKHPDKPWEKEGITRVAWYKRQRKAKEKSTT